MISRRLSYDVPWIGNGSQCHEAEGCEGIVKMIFMFSLRCCRGLFRCQNLTLANVPF